MPKEETNKVEYFENHWFHVPYSIFKLEILDIIDYKKRLKKKLINKTK